MRPMPECKVLIQKLARICNSVWALVRNACDRTSSRDDIRKSKHHGAFPANWHYKNVMCQSSLRFV